LAYFEIMDILDKQKPKPVHDKEAAVKYIQFGESAWDFRGIRKSSTAG